MVIREIANTQKRWAWFGENITPPDGPPVPVYSAVLNSFLKFLLVEDMNAVLFADTL